ncbi:MAG: peptide ABC transporter substrate-binding protein, partial [Pseudobdellovibrionaceae bacterium]
AAVDKAIEELEQEFNAQKRAALAKKIIDIYTREIPVIPLYFRDANSVIPKGMKNYRLSGHLFYETLYAENWELPASK